MISRSLTTACVILCFAAPALAQTAPAPASEQMKNQARNMTLLGSSDLQARSAYQPTVHRQGNRYIAYIGHHGGKSMNPMTGQMEFNGTSIIDVTDPRNPKYLMHIPGEPGEGEAGGAQMTRVCDGKDLPNASDKNGFYLLRTFGNSAHEIWDTTDPSKPQLLARLDGLKGTHKNFWECDTGIAYLVSGAPGWRVSRMTQIYDLSDPAHPKKIRDFGLPGQQAGASGPAPTVLHGPISLGPKVNRVYFGYGTSQGGILQIVDRDKLLTGPTEPTDANLAAPEVGRLTMSTLNGAHTVFPIPKMPIAEFAKDKVGQTRDIVVITDEETENECQQARQMVWFVDITKENSPVAISTWGVRESEGGYCTRGGRFGTHSSNEDMTPIYYGRIMFFAHFNAGVRAVDIRDPYHPKEIASFIPAVTKNTDKRCVKLDNGQERCKIAIQTNNVDVDDRGYIYIVDRANTGMHILELSGPARQIANFPKAATR